MKKLFLFLLISLISLSYIKSQLPQYYSYQDPIDPTNINTEQDFDKKIAFYNDKKIIIPETTPINSYYQVLGDTNGQKRIEIDLTSQQLFAYQNDQLIYSFLISAGKWDRTPNGTFKIWAKIRSQKMSGGSKSLGTYYYLPKVPYIMFFYNDQYPKSMGFSLHGTYWHNNFGTPMSHGCINMKTSEVVQIYNWINDNEIENVPITIYGRYQGKITKK